MIMHASIHFRVRYSECDPMGIVHHAVYPVWFEMGRTELLRSQGGCYRTLETKNLFLVVSELQIKYTLPARYDEELTLTTTLEKVTHVRLMHTYVVSRASQLLTTAKTVLACVDQRGVVQPIPTELNTEA